MVADTCFSDTENQGVRGRVMKPPCKLIGENGNVFNLIAIVKRTLEQYGLSEELEQFHLDLKRLTGNRRHV